MLKKFAARLLCLWVLVPRSASAQDNVPPETLLQSNALFAQGKRELEAGQTAAACSSFAASYQLMQRGGTLLNLGLCREREGQLAEAWRLLRAALAVAQREGRHDRVPLARERIAALENQLSFAAIALPHDIDPSLVALRLDGGPIAREEWTGVPLAPGEHVVSAEAVGFESWSTKFSIGTTPARLVVSIGPLVAHSALELDTPASSPALLPRGYPEDSSPPPRTTLRTREDPKARAAQLREQRQALEGWFVEASVGVTATKTDDDFIETLNAFSYDCDAFGVTLDATAGFMLTRRLGLVFHYDKLESQRCTVPNQDVGSGERYVYSWHSQAVMAGLRLRQPVASHWVVLYADLDVGLAFTVSALEYEVAAGAGYLPKRDDERDRSLALRGLLGVQFGITEHFGVFMAGGFAYAPSLTNQLNETHDAGGGVFLSGIRVHSVKGAW